MNPSPADAKLPPHSPETERALLGAILMDPGSYADVGSHVEQGWFYELRHQIVWNAIVALAGGGAAWDLIGLVGRLRDLGKLDAIGGVAYLNQCMDEVPSVANLPGYVQVLREKEQLRRLLRVSVEVARAIQDGEQAAAEIIGMAQGNILEITDSQGDERERSMRDIMPDVIDRLEQFSQGNKLMAGFSTGFNYLDNMMCGWEPGSMYVIAGRPSTGKTALAMDILLHFVANHGPAAFFSMEMMQLQVGLRALASRARMDFKKFRNGFLKDGQAPGLIEAAGGLCGEPLWIDQTGGLTGREILLRSRRMIRQHGIKLIAIDYLQLMGSVERYRERRDKVAEASSWCKQIARRLDIPVLALAQLNREMERRGVDRAPTLADLAESGAIEQDADFVGGLYRPRLDEGFIQPARDTIRQAKGKAKSVSDPAIQREWYWVKNINTGDPDDEDRPMRESVGRVNLSVLKQRNGPTGDCELLFYKKQMRFADAWKG